MFSVHALLKDGMEELVLTDLPSGNNISIWPSCGAMLHEWNIQLKNKRINIIDHYSSIDSCQTSLEKLGFKSAKLSPFVGRLKNGRYRFATQDYTINKYYLNEHAIHGILYNVPFKVIAQHANELEAAVTMEYEYAGDDTGFPFTYKCVVQYLLRENNQLSITTKIVNTDVGQIPIADGWHPYFNLGLPIDDLQLEFQSKELLAFDADLNLPAGKKAFEDFGSIQKIEATVFDDCFLLNFAECQPLCVLRNPIDKFQLELYPDTSYPYLQIYTPSDRQSIALENMSATPDAFNNQQGLIVLAPKDEKSFVANFTIRLF